MDPFVGLLVVVTVVFSSFPFLKKALRNEDTLTVVVVSYVLGLSFILLPLALVGLLLDNGFAAASWIIFATSLLLLLINLRFIRDFSTYAGKLRNMIKVNANSSLGTIFVASIVFFIFKCLFILALKGIVDYDALDLYLPFARHITIVDHIPLTGYDYQPVVYPQGISILYAWLYSIGGSSFDEAFRFLPVLFSILIMVIVYKIAADLGSTRTAQIAVIVYTLLPLNDAVLAYASYYPDLCFISLMLASFFFLYRYLRKHGTEYCFFGGLALGLSALMKPQFLLAIPATIFLVVVLLRSTTIQLLVTYFVSTLVGCFFIFLVWPSQVLHNLTLDTLFLITAFVFLMTTVVAISVSKVKRTISGLPFKKAFLDLVCFYGTSSTVASIWYVRNYLLTRSFLWSISFQTPNYQWALDFIQSSVAPAQVGDIVSFLSLLVLLPFILYVLGTIWMLPKIIGLFHCSRKHEYLIVIVWMAGYWLSYLWWNLGDFTHYLANPRDLYFLAPFFALLSATGIVRIAEYLTKKRVERAISYLLVSLGLVSLFQSMLIDRYGPNLLRNSFTLLASSFGSSLDALSGRILNYQGPLLSSVPGLLFFTLIVSFLILCPLLVELAFKVAGCQFSVRLKLRIHSKALAKTGVLCFLLFIILVAPYIWLTYEVSGGNVQVFGDAQLRPLYGGLYTEVASYLNNHIEGGTILTTDSAYATLQYYLHNNVKVIALNVPGNLANFREAIESDNVSIVSTVLLQQNVQYFLEPTGISSLMQKLSDQTILLCVLHDPRYFRLAISFPAWKIYESIVGKAFVVEAWDSHFSQQEWVYDKDYSTESGNWSFSNTDVANIDVAGNTQLAFRYSNLPSINTTMFRYLAVRIKGSDNARWLFRLFSQNGTSYDFPYWGVPAENWDIYVFDLSATPLKNVMLGSQVYLDVRSVSNNTATLNLDSCMIFGYSS
jgi:4-amino-4-deoxy-L-arabinose transferase-like glycosyltransferase